MKPTATPGDPFAEFIIWQSDDYRAPDETPLYAHQWAELLDQCRTAHERRVKSYPAMIARNMIAEDLAKRDIAAWELLVAEWRWIITGLGEAPAAHTLTDRLAAVDLAIVRVDQEMARGNRGYDVLRQSHLIEALRWHLLCSTHGEPMIHRCARTNHQLRAEQGTRLCGTCERWETDPATRACSSTNCGLQARKAA